VLFGPKFGAGRLFEHHTTSLVFNDPPYHSRVRNTLVKALAPKRIASTLDLLVPLVREKLATLRDRDEVDVLTEFATQIPVAVICNLLGVPVADQDLLRHWSLLILGALEPRISEAQRAAGDAAVSEFLSYLRKFIDDCAAGRALPGALLESLLSQARAGDLSEVELLHNCIFLLNAGHETTTNLICNGIHMLLLHPKQAQALRQAGGAGRVAVTMVEEVLRYQSPNQLGNREVVREVEIQGERLAVGIQLTLGIGAANRDPEQFAEPDKFDVRRSPNLHLAFASGIHTCAGMALARIEGRVALAEFVRTFPDARISRAPQYRTRLRFRGLDGLFVSTGQMHKG